MKKILSCSIALAGLAMVSSAFAQTCVPSTGTPALGGSNSNTTTAPYDTCGAIDALNQMCSSSGTSGATDAIYSLNLGPGAISGNLTVNTTSPTYDIYIALMQGACSGASPCLREEDANPAGGSETIPLTGLAAGQYYLAVTSFTAGQCGPVTVDLPTLPVTLQGFSVE